MAFSVFVTFFFGLLKQTNKIDCKQIPPSKGILGDEHKGTRGNAIVLFLILINFLVVFLTFLLEAFNMCRSKKLCFQQKLSRMPWQGKVIFNDLRKDAKKKVTKNVYIVFDTFKGYVSIRFRMACKMLYFHCFFDVIKHVCCATCCQ